MIDINAYELFKALFNDNDLELIFKKSEIELKVENENNLPDSVIIQNKACSIVEIINELEALSREIGKQKNRRNFYLALINFKDKLISLSEQSQELKSKEELLSFAHNELTAVSLNVSNRTLTKIINNITLEPVQKNSVNSVCKNALLFYLIRLDNKNYVKNSVIRQQAITSTKLFIIIGVICLLIILFCIPAAGAASLGSGIIINFSTQFATGCMLTIGLFKGSIPVIASLPWIITAIAAIFTIIVSTIYNTSRLLICAIKSLIYFLDYDNEFNQYPSSYIPILINENNEKQNQNQFIESRAFIDAELLSTKSLTLKSNESHNSFNEHDNANDNSSTNNANNNYSTDNANDNSSIDNTNDNSFTNEIPTDDEQWEPQNVDVKEVNWQEYNLPSFK